MFLLIDDDTRNSEDVRNRSFTKNTDDIRKPTMLDYQRCHITNDAKITDNMLQSNVPK